MDESKLVQRLKAGDRQAFDILYEKYKNILLRMAYLVSGSADDAEDVVQETFVKCYLHIGSLKKNTGFQPWLFQILYRTAYAHGKKSRREIPDDEIAVRADATDGVTSLDRILQSERQRVIRTAVQALSFKHRAVVVLFYYNEMPVREIARILSTTEGTVKSRLFAARKKLGESLQQLEEGDREYEKKPGTYLL
ncbi:RNA polymerase sigma factor [Lachnospiraceae bacterium JLR.KK008]